MEEKLYNLEYLKKVLQKNNLWAKKRFGQNFLINKNVLDTIVNSSEIKEKDQIIEVGPGPGVLTSQLLTKTKNLTAIELDKDFYNHLKEYFKNKQNLKLINANALDFPIPTSPYKVIANIPYNITSPLIRHFLHSLNPPQLMTLLIQKEVAEKIVDQKNSILKIMVELIAEAKLIKKVGPKSFFPAPKVESAIIKIRKKQENVTTETIKKTLKVAKHCFINKRKMLRKGLSSLFQITPEIISEFEKIGVDLSQRPEKISTDKWIKMADILLK